jgi:hypothetical protein
MQKTEEDKSVNYVFCKSITITEIHDSSPHVCKNYFILLLVFNIFVFTNTQANCSLYFRYSRDIDEDYYHGCNTNLTQIA